MNGKQCFSAVSVALLTESVDRNIVIGQGQGVVPASLSSRRAWIEIFFACKSGLTGIVALLTESVDRNNDLDQFSQVVIVALLTESVDRNFLHFAHII